MGSYENVVKIEEIKKKVSEGDLLSAQRILDTMEIRKIKNMTDLGVIAGVYADNERYEEASELYVKIYEKTKSRKALYQLVEILIKLNNAEDAQYYLRQYEKIAPRDYNIYVFRYKLAKLRGESFENQIEILEELKNAEYTEKWAYELAKLYYKAGMEEECIRVCSDIELWFGEGTYVEKARILRSTYSGEADKERIMEEIRRRAELVGSLTEDNEHPDHETGTYYGNAEEELDPVENTEDPEGELYTGTDFMLHEDTGELEDDLKKDIQNIMTQDQPEEVAEYYYDEELPDTDAYRREQEEQPDLSPEGQTTEYAYAADEAADTKTDVTHQETVMEAEASVRPENEGPAKEKEAVTSRELSAQAEEEQEVEKVIYQALREDEMDEEDRKLKQLTQELQIDTDELFGNFLHILSVKKQLVKSLEMILSERSRLQMMIITGTEGSGKTTLAKDMALFYYKSGKLKSSKLAKISADKLNTVDILTKKEILRDCCLVVENASELKRTTIDSLLELANQLHGDLAIIFEEDKKNMNKLFREYPKLMDLLKNRIHLPQYNMEDLMGFAFACLSQKDYRLEMKAEQVLQGKINQIAKQSEPHRHLEQIYDLMQAAMNAADIRMGRQLSELASQGRLKDVDAVTVTAQDLNIKP